jgi:hypothetical protein
MRAAAERRIDYSFVMSPNFDRLRQEATSLDEAERASLALELLESLEPDQSTADVEAQWNAEALRRVELLDRGEMATISADDLHSGAPLPDEQ